MNLEEARDALATAVRNAVGEHGAPNRFSLGELARLYGAPSPKFSGRVCRRYMHLLQRTLGDDWHLGYEAPVIGLSANIVVLKAGAANGR